jgi:RNA polymerase sigma-70 factor (ECF subfamily)
MNNLKESKSNSMTLQEIGMKFFESRTEKDFTKMYHRLRPSISFYLKDMVPHQDDRNEVIANTFEKVWRKIHQYDPYWNFSTWVYRISRNEALLFFRSRRKTYSYEGMEEMGINLEAKAQSYQTKENLHEDHPIDRLHDMALLEIKNLPDMYRTVLTMYQIDKKKYEDIADELNWNHNTVRTRIRKARGIVRTNLLQKQPELVKMYNEEIA